jgi:hypothetical protein
VADASPKRSKKASCVSENIHAKISERILSVEACKDSVLIVEMSETPTPICKCMKCGSEFTIRPVVGKDTVATYAERLSKEVFCFNCGSGGHLLSIIA